MINACRDDGTTLSKLRSSSNTFPATQTHITVPPRSHFFLKVYSNPTTGYGWSIHPISRSLLSSDSSKVSFFACGYVPHPHEPNIVGSGGDEIWEFVSGDVNDEVTKIGLQYQRPWLGDKDEATQT
ncbi:unnamed protein product, partial [Didymodactylos carnosus]